MNKKDIPAINVDYFENLTGKLPRADEGEGEDVGVRIARMREEKGISLEELSRLTGFSVEELEGIENNTIHPQLGTIMRLSKALDSAMSRLISGQGSKAYSITRRGEGHSVSRASSGKGGGNAYIYYSLAPEVLGRNMEALMVELEEGKEPENRTHEGEEFVFVLSGTVRLVIGEETFDLSPGDSAYYLSGTPHSISGLKGKATILAVLHED